MTDYIQGGQTHGVTGLRLRAGQIGERREVIPVKPVAKAKQCRRSKCAGPVNANMTPLRPKAEPPPRRDDYPCLPVSKRWREGDRRDDYRGPSQLCLLPCSCPEEIDECGVELFGVAHIATVRSPVQNNQTAVLNSSVRSSARSFKRDNRIAVAVDDQSRHPDVW